MAESVADEILLGILAESTYGVDPGTARQLLRVTGESLESVASTVQSQELTGDRQIADVVRTDFGVQGDINFELSAEAFDDLFKGLLMSSSLGDNGSTLKSFVLEREYSDQSTLSAIFLGCMVNTFELNVAPGAIVTGKFGIVGRSESAGTGMTTPTAASTNPVLNAVDNVTAMTEGGGAITILGLTLRANNNLRPRPVVGSLYPQSQALGSLDVNGTLRIYFQNATLYNKFLNQTESSLAISIQTTGSKGYSFTVYRTKYTKARRVAGGKNTDIIVDVEWQGLKKTSSPLKTLNIAALTA